MMLLEVALLIVTLSHDGYWIGGEPATVYVQWAVEPAPAEATTFAWQLGWRDTKLAEGRAEIAGDDVPTEISITPPTVRTRTRLTLTWRLLDDDGNALERGSTQVHISPAVTARLAVLKAALDEQRVVVFDDDDGLPGMFERAELEHERVESLTAVVPGRVDLLIVGQNQLHDDDAQAQTTMRRIAELGGTVIVFAQPRATRLLGFRTPQRLPPPVLAYRADAPLFGTLSSEDIASWLPAESEPWRAVRLEPDDAVTPLALWPPLPRFEDDRGKPKPVEDALDAAVAQVRLGEGRVLLWQIPLGDWRDDPRSGAALANAIDWALGPTPSTASTLELGKRALWRHAGDEDLDESHDRIESN